MEQGPSSEVNRPSDIQEISQKSWNPKVHHITTALHTSLSCPDESSKHPPFLYL